MTEKNTIKLLAEHLRFSNSHRGDIEACAEALVSEHPRAVEAFLEEGNNNGLLFHIAGFNGDKQQEIADFYSDVFDVEVF